MADPLTPFDLLLLAFKGIAVASLPVTWIWVRRAGRGPGDRLRRLAWVTAFFTFDLILFGGFTRLTDSGLGCPDWPGCYARANPFMASSHIREAEAAMPFGPVSMSKAWIEMIHRYLAMAVGVLIIVMLVTTVVRWRAARRRATGPGDRRMASPAFASGLLVLVLLQGAFGAWTVTQKLQPIFVTTHLLLGLTLFAALVWHALRLEPSDDRGPRAGTTSLRWIAGLAMAVLVVQVALGGWVSANYAVLACTEFPKCHGVWIPPMDFANAFHLWRPLGRAADGSFLTVEALTAIHWTHRGFAAVVLVAAATLAWRVRSIGGLRRTGLVLFGLLLLQLGTGLVNVLFAWPLVVAVLHNGGAAALVGVLVMINYRLASPRPPVFSHLARADRIRPSDFAGAHASSAFRTR